MSSPLPPRHILPARLRHTVHTLLLASAVCTAMLVVRCLVAHKLRFMGLFWNLILAWIPFGLALVLPTISRLRAGGRRLWWFLAVLWFLFFPNAFYLVTDLIHMKKFGLDGIERWYDLLMTAAFAFGGAFLGSLSLYLLHLRVRERFGWPRGWAFAAGMLLLGSFGIYLGRFFRLNSWDVFTRPGKLLVELSRLLQPAEAMNMFAFCTAFFCFSFAIYAFVVSMARLHEEGDGEGV